jgi:geranylgeranyl diphosphate synthase type II
LDLTKELKKNIEIIDKELKNIISRRDIYQDRIFKSIDYSLFTGGKRLRPIMTLKSCQIFNDDITHAIPYALAIEMIHTYSLIHDDLPSMDDDEFRRGKPTNHMVFGEAMAILSGDGLLNLAFEVISEYAIKNSINIDDYKKHIRSLQEISRYSGIYGMIGGQVVDLMANHDTMTEDKLLFMYKTKTAALIRAALVSGAIMGGASDDEIEVMREFGLNLGLAYQIRDDILDIQEDNSIKKLTYLSFHDIETAKEDIDKYSNKAIDSLKKLKDKDITFFTALTEELINRDI